MPQLDNNPTTTERGGMSCYLFSFLSTCDSSKPIGCCLDVWRKRLSKNQFGSEDSQRTNQPINPAPAISHAELMRERMSITVLMIRTPDVIQSITETRPNCQATTAISANDPTTTPSKIADASADLKQRGRTPVGRSQLLRRLRPVFLQPNSR